MMSAPTLITAWWDLKRRGLKTSMHYLGDFAADVLALDAPMVIFCDPELVDLISEKRGSHGPTRLISQPFEESPSIQIWNERAKECKVATNYRRGREYMLMSWSKPILVRSVAEWNPFGTERFDWVDIGVTHAAKGVEIVTKGRSDDRVHFMVRVKLDPAMPRDVYYKQTRAWVASGYWGGSTQAVAEYAERFIAEADRVVADGILACDEDIAGRVVVEHPDDFDLTYGEYNDLFFVADHTKFLESLKRGGLIRDYRYNAGDEHATIYPVPRTPNIVAPPQTPSIDGHTHQLTPPPRIIIPGKPRRRYGR